ncbi:hypothetical protein FACS189444_6850 [Spirochaetia bacterium]|nr:hypothetical protein FACS189444_6850 [Spirochaetia bacterium]
MKSIDMPLNGMMFAVANNRWRFTQTRLEYVAQKVRHAVSIVQREWYFDRTLGIPYIPEDSETKFNHRLLIESKLQTTITGVPGVVKLMSFTSEEDKANRTLTIRFTAMIGSGETFDHQVVF